MAYADLTQEEQQVLQDWLNTIVRPWCGEQGRTNNHGEIGNDVYNGQTLPILDLLDDGDIIPNESGLSGSQSLTKAEVTNIVSSIQGILATYNTEPQRQLWGKAAGGKNMIG